MNPRPLVNDGWRQQKHANRLEIFCLRIPLMDQQRTSTDFWSEGLDQVATLQRCSLLGQNSRPPYFPLLTAIKEAFKDFTPKEREAFFQKLPLYPLHQPIWRNYLFDETEERLDLVFLDREEISFEKMMLFQGILAVLTALFPQEPLTLVLEHFEDASPSLLDFLNWLLERSGNFPLRLVVLFNHSKDLLPGGMTERWQVFLNNMEENGLILHKALKLTRWIQEDKKGKEERLPPSLSPLHALELQKAFFAFEDPNDFLKEELSELLKVRVHQERGLIHLLGGRYLEALIELQEAVTLGRNFSWQDLWRVQLLLALTYFRNKNQKLAEKTFYNSAQFFPFRTTQLKDDPFLLYQIFIFEQRWGTETNQGIYRRIVALSPEIRKVYLRVLQGQMSYFHNIEKIFRTENAIALAKVILSKHYKDKNEFRAARVHHFLGYLYQSHNPEEALHHYNKCIQLRSRLGVTESLIRAYNGMGYFCSQIGSFDQAIENYREALQLLEQGEDFVEISLTLFNIAQVYFLAGHFEQALMLYQRLLSVMDAKALVYIPFHPICQIHSYCGLSAYYIGRFTSAVDYFELAQKSYDPHEPRPIYFLFQSLISDVVGAGFDPLEKLGEAEDLCKRTSAFQLFVQVKIEECRFLRKNEKHQKAQKVLEELLKQEYLQPGTFQYNLVQHFLYGGDWDNSLPVKFSQLPIEHLTDNVLAMARRSGAYDQVFEKMDQMGFLKNFQNQLQNESTVDGLLERCWEIFRSEFKFSQLLMMEKRFDFNYSAIQEKEIEILPEPWRGEYRQEAGVGLRRRVYEQMDQSWVQLPFFTDKRSSFALAFSTPPGQEGVDSKDLSVLEMALKDLNLTIRYIKERDRSETLLRNVFPGPIAVRLMSGEDDLIADRFPMVSILFADLVNFTPYASKVPAGEMIENLNLLFSRFDDLVAGYGLEKIKTIGDAYMVAGGIPEGLGHRAKDMANLALDLIRVTKTYSNGSGVPWQIRCGLHAGPVVAGVIGKHRFSYDVWGDTVNFASRLESHGTPGKIHVSAHFKDLIEKGFEFESRGVVEIKGMSSVETFFLSKGKET